MSDLVSTVTSRLLYAIPQDGGDRRTDEERREDFEELARAAIAAVLDDLMERAPGLAQRWAGPAGYTSYPLAEVLRDILSRERGRLLPKPDPIESCNGDEHITWDTGDPLSDAQEPQEDISFIVEGEDRIIG